MQPQSQPLKIKELLTLAPGSPVLAVAGLVRAVSQFQSGLTDGNPWSLQQIMLEDETGSIPAEISNHGEIPQAYADSATTLYLNAGKKANGGPTGLRIDEEVNPENNRPYKILSVARAAQIATTAPTAPAPTPPPPALPTMPQPAPEPTQAAPATAPAAVRMRVTELQYRKGYVANGHSESIGITLELAEGTKAAEALEVARRFVNNNLPQALQS